jgi:HEAT repeat protein
MKYRSILFALAALCLSAAGARAQVEVREAQLPAGLSADVRQQVLALASKDAARRAQAACALGEAGTEAVPAIPYLVALMGDGTPLAPSALCKNAEPFEDEAWQPDFEQVYEPSPGEAATQALVALGAPAIEPLLDALKAPQWRTRKNAAWALGHRGDERATPLLADALKDEAWQVRCEAAYALSQRGGDRVLERLVAALKDEAWQVRAMAALALGQKGDARVLEPLRAATRDRNRRVRATARMALQMKSGFTSGPSGRKGE